MSGRAGFNTPKRQSEPQIASEAFAQISCIISTLWEVPYRHGGEVPPEKTQVDDAERECVSSAVPRLDRLSCAPTCAFAVSFTSQLWNRCENQPPYQLVTMRLPSWQNLMYSCYIDMEADLR